MKQSNLYPPNYEIIISRIPAVATDTRAIFCYGDTIYNPHNREITNDLEIHEGVHSEQQKKLGIDEWWVKYLSDKNFRLKMEIEAYGTQYAFAKEAIETVANEAAKRGEKLIAGKNNLIRYALESMATALSGETYGNIISYGEAESKIRNYAKNN